MATITYDAAGPGKGGRRPGFFMSPRPMMMVTGQFSFDSSYPTGGESISDIADQFGEFLGIWMEDPVNSTGTGKHIVIDYTADAEKALLYTEAAAEVANASDQSNAASLRFFAWGYVKGR